jgi:hypothetical protein
MPVELGPHEAMSVAALESNLNDTVTIETIE